MVILREGECPGLTAEVIQALRSQNVRTVVDLVSSDIEELARKCALSYKTLVAVKRVLLAQYTAFPTNGADLYEELLSSTAILSTGNPSLDKLLDSGLYTGEVTELIGAPGSGKTQVCLGVAVSVACDLKRNILYIDSTGGLSASRLLQMVQSKACKMEEHMEALRRIQVRQVFSVFSLIEALQDLRSSGFHQVAGGSGSVKVVIVDSVAAVLSPIMGGRQTEGLSLMMQLAGELRTMARDLGVAVLVTNHMTRDGNGVVKAGLGRSWSHVPRTRVLLQRVEREGAKPSGLRTATLVKSSRQPSQISQEFDLGACNQPQDLLPAPRA
ncbi:DNA repair protein RAD51 homolog 4 isoform X1 [Acipenser ruthenus]|uniref:DNA repair protein RAD51 homolog 4 isoform X1 n=1 Tax=Acipenser ruthenus TaxID=7906 RepID=UPI0027426B67|nr:DNA repair protein RAD51 homolog 4 isoform X1 [Acipenser ruthenus]XP_033904156.3 DNA repair protein RAD51 homolog 4 isoform X1 [Acipenser ruthenus]